MLARLNEILFFFFCRRIIYQTKQISEVHELFKALAFTKLYNPDILIDVATDMFIKNHNPPLLIECVLIREAKPNVLSLNAIKKNFKVDNTQIEKIINLARFKNLSSATIKAAYPREVQEAILGFKKALKQVLSWEAFIDD